MVACREDILERFCHLTTDLCTGRKYSRAHYLATAGEPLPRLRYQRSARPKSYQRSESLADLPGRPANSRLWSSLERARLRLADLLPVLDLEQHPLG